MLPVWVKPQDPLAVKRGNGFGPKYSREVQLTQAKYFNCRKETISQARTMWATARKTRCVVPAQGYFEWKKDKSEKTPYFVHLASSPLIYFAGLYSHNHNYDEHDIVPKDLGYFSSFAILTGPGTGKGSNDLSWLHSRKPIVLQPNSKEWFEWLDPERQFDESLVETALNTDTNPAYDSIATYIVSKSIGNPTNEGEDAIREVKKTQKSIGLFFLLPTKGKKEVKNEEAKNEEVKKEEVKKEEVKKDEVKKEEVKKEEAKKEEVKKEEVKKEDKEKDESKTTDVNSSIKHDDKPNDQKFPKVKKEPELKREHSHSTQFEPISKRIRQEHQGSEMSYGFRHEEENEEESEDDDD